MNLNIAGIPVTSTRIRISIIFFIGFLMFSALGIQLWNMQVVNGEYYRKRQIKQSARRIRIPAVRGRILDRDGKPIAENRVSYNVQFHLEDMRSPKSKETNMKIMANAELAAQCIGRENPLTAEDVNRYKNTRPGIPMTVFRDLNPVELGKIHELCPGIKGLEVTAEPVRDYPQGNIASQLIGYVSSEDPNTAEDRAEYFYYISDLVGRSGIERIYNEKLKGSPGCELVMVNSNGFVHEILDIPAEAVNGFDIQLTIDSAAQKTAERLLRGYTAAMTVMDAQSGEVLVMASSPTYAPQDFVPRISVRKFREINSDPRHPFLNRVTMGSYLPGSIIKPLCGLAVLESGISSDETEDCQGISAYGYGAGIKCNNLSGHGIMDLHHAIMKSCNVYFVNKGVIAGINALSRMYASAGIGSKTGIEISEVKGYLPKDGPRWNRQETAYVAFGQGRVEVTPLQAACYFGAIANGGKLLRPYVISHICNPNYDKPVSVMDTQSGVVRGHLAASQKSIEEVKKGMYMVVHEPGGSGAKANSSRYEIYGKTGTADIVERGVKSKNVWFAGFARKPETGRIYSFALVVEHGGSGGGTAAPIIKNFFDSWK